MATTTQQPQPLRGTIERGVIYPLGIFQQRTGLGRKAVAKLRQNGMPIRRAGRNAFVSGDDFHDVLTRPAKQSS